MGCSGSAPAKTGNINNPDHANSNNSGIDAGVGGDDGREGGPSHQPGSASGNSAKDHVPDDTLKQNPPISTQERLQPSGNIKTEPVTLTGSLLKKTDEAPNVSTENKVTQLATSESDLRHKPPTQSQTPDKSTPQHSGKTAEVKLSQDLEIKTECEETMASFANAKTNTEAKSDNRTSSIKEAEQKMFNSQVNGMNLSVDQEKFVSGVKNTVSKLTLSRALPHTVNLSQLVHKISNLQELDVSNNQLGPQPFRLLMLALATNTTLLSLKAANNSADTDSAVCIGKLLTTNSTLLYLDVSGNHLGKDYLSRCVGPALKVNNTLQTFRMEGTGATDVKELLAGLADNTTLTQLDVSNNDISDRGSVGTALGMCLQKGGCVLESVNLRNCNMCPEGLEKLREGLSQNTSLLELVISGNEFKTVDNVMKFVLTSCSHPTLQQFTADNTKVTDDTLKTDIPSISNVSSLRMISLSNSGLTANLLRGLESCLKGKLLCLEHLNLSDNPNLSADCISNVIAMTTGDTCQSSITRLNFNLNEAEMLPEVLTTSSLPLISYLNLRKAKISPVSVCKLQTLITPKEGPLKTLVLDGLKLAGTDALKGLLGKTGDCSLVALSLSGCLLSDSDLSPLTSALKSGLSLHMLKLSANRITDKGVTDIASCLLDNKHHPLAVLDLSNNQIGSEGATSLERLFSSKPVKSQLHSLNLSHNNIGKDGLSALVNHVGAQLKTLYLNNQSISLDEEEVSEVLKQLAGKLGYSLQYDDSGRLKESCGPNINTEGVFVNLSGLGGHYGEAGRLVDCASVVTDYRARQVPHLSLKHVCQLAAVLRKSATEKVVLSSEEWDIVTGCKKDREIPSWLKLAESRSKAVYLTNLPGTTTARRLEGLFESEADCNIDEICLLKDPVSRKMNGLAWALMSDTASVDRLMEYFHRGEAQVFGQSFLISPILITVDDAASAEVEEQARQDRMLRAKERQSDDAKHRNLIRESAEESWKRHAYRLAHPAYADGRVW